MKQIIFFIFILVIFQQPSRAQFITPLEDHLYRDIEDHRLDDFSHIEAAFILSGVRTDDSLRYYIQWYNNLIKTIKDYNIDPYDRINFAGHIFSYLHSSWLLSYQETATTLLHVVKEKRYNCVAGTILYNLVCEDLGLITEAFETPTHTYTIFPNYTEVITVENTSPIGFNIMKNLRAYSEYLLQFYPEKKAYQIGLDRIYAHENQNGRQINNTELLGLLAYNRAYFAHKKINYEKAYNFVLLAQKFNQDSRSNYNFEIVLYYAWGQQCIERGNYQKAFQIFADAYSRYWENDNFAHNCKVAYFYAQQENWQKKEWNTFTRVANSMLNLKLLDDKDFNNMRNYMHNWVSYFYNFRTKSETLHAVDYWWDIFPDDPFLKSVRSSY